MSTGMTSSRPYLVRAVYEWITDNGLTPYLLVNAQVPGTQVPTQYIEDGKIVLNLGQTATRELQLGNEWIEFDTRFSGTRMRVVLPVQAVMAIYARENGQGIVFNEEQEGSRPPPEPPGPGPKPGAKQGSKRPGLKLVK
jgi:stringent starvation protein B